MSKNNLDLSTINLFKNIGMEVRSNRLIKKQTIEEFSKNCKITPSTLQYIESANSDIEIDDLLHICRYLEIEIAAFFDKVENENICFCKQLEEK